MISDITPLRLSRKFIIRCKQNGIRKIFTSLSIFSILRQLSWRWETCIDSLLLHYVRLVKGAFIQLDEIKHSQHKTAGYLKPSVCFTKELSPSTLTFMYLPTIRSSDFVILRSTSWMFWCELLVLVHHEPRFGCLHSPLFARQRFNRNASAFHLDRSTRFPSSSLIIKSCVDRA